MQYPDLWIKNLKIRKRHQMHYLIIYFFLCIITVVCVGSALIKPADAMSESDGCSYQIICTDSSADHFHTSSCYGWVCTDAAHIHDTSPEYEAVPGSMFGAATHFHIFADEISIHSHTHGNIATNFLYYKSRDDYDSTINDFGIRCNNLCGMTSVNYIRDYAGILNDSTLQTKLVLGNGSKFRYNSIDRKYMIYSESGIRNNAKPSWIRNDCFTGNKDNVPIVIEGLTPYIDIRAELEKLSVLSQKIASKEDTGGLQINLYEEDMNKTVLIDCAQANEKYIYGSLDVSDDNRYSLIKRKNISISGIGPESNKVLFLNINVGDRSCVDFADKQWAMTGNSQFQELPLDEGGIRIVYNFIKITESGPVPYDGKINLRNQIHGTILAPDAEVVNGSNINGNIIADKFSQLGGETHRADVQVEDTEDDDEDWPLLSDETLDVTVKKGWSNTGTHENVNIVLYCTTNMNTDLSMLTDAQKVLYNAESEAIQPVQILNEESGWSYTWSGLPVKDSSGNVLYYFVKETPVSGYNAEYHGNAVSLVSGTVDITNIKLVDISVNKKWSFYDDNGDIIDDTSHGNISCIQFELYRSVTHTTDSTLPQDAEKAGGPYSINDPEWKCEITGLPQSENGQELYYYAKEINVPEGYTAVYTTDHEAGTILIENQRNKPSMISVKVIKKWNNASGVTLHPESVTVALMRKLGADGEYENIREPVTVTDEYTFSDLIKHDSSNTSYYYKIEELNVPEGYEVSYTQNDGIMADLLTDGDVHVINITNTQKTGQLKVSKTWKNDPEGIDSVTVELYRSSSALGVQQTPDTDNTVQTTYSVSQPAGGVPDVSLSPAQPGNIPDFSQAELVSTITLDASSGWSTDFSSLPLCDENGNQFIYYIREKYITGTGAHNYEIYDYSDICGITLSADNGGCLSVSNILKKSVIMPSTGSSGVGIIQASGSVIMILTAGLYIFLIKRDKRKNN
ncbi:MAG: Cna B-type domain-containing protein [Oscillospiraceae bacterium]|nr:Cna B-type domain-containing protein [Oscillospiraceae bacterium]